MRADAVKTQLPEPETVTLLVKVATPETGAMMGEERMQLPEAMERVTEFVTEVSVVPAGN